MPPIVKFTKEQIIKASINIIRKYGYNSLSARNIAKELNSSTKPIFMLFNNMDTLNTQVENYCKEIYMKMASEEMSNYKDKYYKAYGMSYIKFALKEKEIFKYLYLRDRKNEALFDKNELEPIIETIVKSTGLNKQDAYLFHLEMWLFIHGIATTIVTNFTNWDIDFVSELLTDQFIGMKKRFLEKNKKD